MGPLAIPFVIGAAGAGTAAGGTTAVAAPMLTTALGAAGATYLYNHPELLALAAPVINQTQNVTRRIGNGVGTVIGGVSNALSPVGFQPSAHYEHNVMGIPTRSVAVSDNTAVPVRVLNVGPKARRVKLTTSGQEAANSSAPTERTDSTTREQAPVQPQAPNNNKKNDRLSLRERITGRRNTLTNNTTPEPPHDNKQGSLLSRILWETKNNNFGDKGYAWRNVGRLVPYGAAATDLYHSRKGSFEGKALENINLLNYVENLVYPENSAKKDTTSTDTGQLPVDTAVIADNDDVYTPMVPLHRRKK